MGASFNDILIDCDCVDFVSCLEMKKGEMQAWAVLIMDWNGMEVSNKDTGEIWSVVYHPTLALRAATKLQD